MYIYHHSNFQSFTSLKIKYSGTSGAECSKIPAVRVGQASPSRLQLSTEQDPISVIFQLILGILPLFSRILQLLSGKLQFFSWILQFFSGLLQSGSDPWNIATMWKNSWIKFKNWSPRKVYKRQQIMPLVLLDIFIKSTFWEGGSNNVKKASKLFSLDGPI